MSFLCFYELVIELQSSQVRFPHVFIFQIINIFKISNILNVQQNIAVKEWYEH